MRIIEIPRAHAMLWADVKEYLEPRPSIKVRGVVDDGICRAICLYDDDRIYYVYTSECSRNQGLASLLIDYTTNLILQLKETVTAVVERQNVEMIRILLTYKYIIAGFSVTNGDNRYVMIRGHKNATSDPKNDDLTPLRIALTDVMEKTLVVEVLPTTYIK